MLFLRFWSIHDAACLIGTIAIFIVSTIYCPSGFFLELWKRVPQFIIAFWISFEECWMALVYYMKLLFCLVINWLWWWVCLFFRILVLIWEGFCVMSGNFSKSFHLWNWGPILMLLCNLYIHTHHLSCQSMFEVDSA